MSSPVAAGTIQAVFAGVLTALTLLGPLAPAATTDTAPPNSDDPVTWTVSPADAGVPDGRAWIEVELDPGDSITEHLAVRNLSTQDVTFTLSAADGYFTDTGRFNMLSSDAKSVDSGTWIDIQPDVTVAENSTVIVPFTITVPLSATPGDHAAGVAASIRSDGSADGTRVGVESRIGFRVMTRIAGELEPSMKVTSDATYDMSWNPFRPGELVVHAALTNTGNTRLKVSTSVEFAGVTYAAQSSGENGDTELLPGDTRTLTFQISEVWPLGCLLSTITAKPASVPQDTGVPALAPITADVQVTALPLPQLTAIAALILIVFGFLIGRRRQAAKLKSLLQDAHDAGRRAANTEHER